MKRLSTFRDFVGELTVTYKRTTKPTVLITRSEDAADYARQYFDEIMDDHEEMKVLHLNQANEIVNVHHASSGDVTGTLAPITMILQQALLIKTKAIILVHNHPSGNTNPSSVDIGLTKKLAEACKYVDLRLLDHIILTRESFYSLSDNGKF